MGVAAAEGDRNRPVLAVVCVALAASGIGLYLGYWVKTQCSTRERVLAGWQWSHNCYSDIVSQYRDRPEAFRRPGYKPFSAHGLAYRDNNLEYPPLTGLFISGVNAPVRAGDGAGFLRANALGLAGFGLLGAAALAAAAKRPARVLLYALSPALVSYAFLNWDLIPVGLTAAGLWGFSRRRDAVAGLMLGLGAAAKFYPALFVPVLVIARLKQQRGTGALIGWSVAGFVVPSLIVLAYADIDAWWFPFRMQSLRGPNPETHWFIVRHQLDHLGIGRGSSLMGPDFGRVAQALSGIAFLASSAFLLRAEARRPRFRPLVACFGIALLYMLTAKVYSPQYALWLLPFFVLVRIPWHGYAAFAIGDLFVLGAIWSFYFHHSTFEGSPFVILQVAVLVRYATLGYLLWLTRTGMELFRPGPLTAERSLQPL